ncbi:MAG: hypothetical protein WDZ93_01480 [Candidatus Paceibacterota bacterium]
MLLNSITVRWVILIAFLVIGILGALLVHDSETAAIERCEKVYTNEVAKIDCWQEVIRGVFVSDGTQAAFDVFERIYREYDTFSNTGCHRHAHRVGDMAYYFDYLTHRDLDRTEFPPNATACGYGFYHGFFEHLIQDNPDPAFVSLTCAYMDERLKATAPGMRQTCYHGSGHGFLLARADTLVDPREWTLRDFVDVPLAQCESLPDASPFEISECRQGIYNVIVDWMSDEEYGFTYDRESPFRICDSEAYERQPDCYYEMAQKVDGLSNHDPAKAAAIAQTAKRKDMQSTIMTVAVSGMVQHRPKEDQQQLLASCRTVPEELLHACIVSLAGGLVEHGTSSGDFEHVFAFCEESGMTETEQTICYEGLYSSISRFVSEAELQTACAKGQRPELFCRFVAEAEAGT